MKTKYVLKERCSDGWHDIIDDSKKSEIIKKKNRLIELHPGLVLKIFKRDYEIIINVINETAVNDE